MNQEKSAAVGVAVIVNTSEAASRDVRLTGIISDMPIAIIVGAEDGRETGGSTMSEKSEKIKKGLMACSLPSNSTISKCAICPYKNVSNCSENMNKDALAYINLREHSFDDLNLRVAQLEAQVPKWMNDDGSILCPYCGTAMRMIPAWQKTMPDMGGYVWSARGKCPACGSITPEMHGRTAKEANAAAYAAAQWGHIPLPEPPKEEA